MIIVERQNGNDKQIWWFAAHMPFRSSEVKVVLKYYAVLRRETARHKFKTIHEYQSPDRRLGDYYGLSLSAVPTPDDVWQEAREAVKVEVVV